MRVGSRNRICPQVADQGIEHVDHLQLESFFFDLAEVRRGHVVIADAFLRLYLDIKPLELCDLFLRHVICELTGVEISL